MISNLNGFFFSLMNAPVTPSPVVVASATFLADWIIRIVALAMVLGWIRGRSGLRLALFRAGLSVMLAMSVALFAATAWYVPRPFAAGFGHQLIPHAADSSFPSDHATVLFAVAWALLFERSARLWGWVTFLAAASVAWARIYLGVHWPLDMVGAMVISAVAACVVRFGLPQQTAKLAKWGETVYVAALDLARLPAKLFPRSHG
jgi:undecaprenyl-diphosphatase